MLLSLPLDDFGLGLVIIAKRLKRSQTSNGMLVKIKGFSLVVNSTGALAAAARIR